ETAKVAWTRIGRWPMCRQSRSRTCCRADRFLAARHHPARLAPSSRRAQAGADRFHAPPAWSARPAASLRAASSGSRMTGKYLAPRGPTSDDVEIGNAAQGESQAEGGFMSDLDVEAYKKGVVKAVDRYAAKLEKIGKDLAPIDADLAKLEAIKSPGPDDKKKITDLSKQRDALREKADNAGLELKLDLMLIEPPANADPKELIKLPDWMEKIIKAKGIPLGKGVSIAPDISFDFKAKKLKRIGIVIHFP
ncbi:MAG: hypothetical protein KGI51_08120, partial [Rhodospirillales bacterium]|nr:hypothetical protein [Rhodospirillales bacterium]